MTSRALLFLCLSAITSCTRKPADAPLADDYDQSSPEGQCLNHANAQQTVPTDAPESISVSHILVRHAALARPDGATRTRGEACLRALSALEALQGGAEWNDVVREYSDAGKSNHGDLGTIHKDEVTPAFRDAAFSLQTNELSYVVETDRGFHVILRH